MELATYKTIVLPSKHWTPGLQFVSLHPPTNINWTSLPQDQSTSITAWESLFHKNGILLLIHDLLHRFLQLNRTGSLFGVSTKHTHHESIQFIAECPFPSHSDNAFIPSATRPICPPLSRIFNVDGYDTSRPLFAVSLLLEVRMNIDFHSERLRIHWWFSMNEIVQYGSDTPNISSRCHYSRQLWWLPVVCSKVLCFIFGVRECWYSIVCEFAVNRVIWSRFAQDVFWWCGSAQPLPASEISIVLFILE